MRAFLALLKTYLRLALRDRWVLLFNCLLPVACLVAFVRLAHAEAGRGIAYAAGMALTVGVLGNAVWGAGMRAASERQAGVLRRLQLTAVGPLPILLAWLASGWLLYMPAVALLVAVAHFGYAMPLPRNWSALWLMATLALAALRAMELAVASAANSARQAAIAIATLNLPMLLLSGVAIPAATQPVWAQTLAQFLPASCLVNGFQEILFHGWSAPDAARAAVALPLTAALGVFAAVRLFRWQPGERLRPRNRLWVVAAMAPFLLLGSFRAHTRDHLAENEALYRDLARCGEFLIRNVRIFVGDGGVIENGYVLVRDGTIARVGEGEAPGGLGPHAAVIDGAGKTLLPGLIDVHVHLGAPAGVSTSRDDYDNRPAMAHAAAALLYSGVTAARSVGDGLEGSLALRRLLARGGRLGARIFACGPMFTAEGGGATQFMDLLPETVRNSPQAPLLRSPATPEEAQRQVTALKAAGVDCVKAILEAGWGEAMRNDRLDLLLVRSVSESAHELGLPLAVHTGSAEDVTDAVEMGAASVEHGAWRDEIPRSVLARMARDGVYLDPTLGELEAFARYYSGNTAALSAPLAAETVPAGIVAGTRALVGQGGSADAAKAEMYLRAFEQAKQNLVAAWQAEVPLAMGTGAGSPMVFHGPSLHHELQLWVEAGIPAPDALEAATLQAARLLGAKKTGAIRAGWDADLLLVDGNPLEDITATSLIALVVFQGERIRREELMRQR